MVHEKKKEAREDLSNGKNGIASSAMGETRFLDKGQEFNSGYVRSQMNETLK